MAVDPKELLARNKVLVICYVLALVPIILWVVLVVGGVQGGKGGFDQEKKRLVSVKNTLESLKRDIESKPDTVYTPSHIEAYNKRNEQIGEQYKTMVGMLEKKDEALERWFDPSWAKDKDPPEQQFQTELTTRLNALRETYKAMVVDTGPNATSFLWNEPVVKGNQRSLQKKYWVQEAVLKGLKDGGAERLLATVEFFSSAPQGAPIPNGPVKINYVVPIPVRVIVTSTFRDIPRIVKELLSQEIVLKVTKVKAELLPFSVTIKELGVFVNADPKPIYPDTTYIAGQGTPPNEQEKVLPEPKIKLTLELEAVDIDIDLIHKNNDEKK